MLIDDQTFQNFLKSLNVFRNSYSREDISQSLFTRLQKFEASRDDSSPLDGRLASYFLKTWDNEHPDDTAILERLNRRGDMLTEEYRRDLPSDDILVEKMVENTMNDDEVSLQNGKIDQIYRERFGYCVRQMALVLESAEKYGPAMEMRHVYRLDDHHRPNPETE